MHEQDQTVQSSLTETPPTLPFWKKYGQLLWLLFVLAASAVIGGIYVTSYEKTYVQPQISAIPSQTPPVSQPSPWKTYNKK